MPRYLHLCPIPIRTSSWWSGRKCRGRGTAPRPAPTSIGNARTSSSRALGTYGGADFNLSTGERPEQIPGSLLTVGFLDEVYGEKPFLGRYFLPDEAVAGKDHVVILTNRLWRDHFGSDSHIIGREIHLNGEAYTVIGVRPLGMGDRTTDRLHAPLVFKPEQINHDFHRLISSRA